MPCGKQANAFRRYRHRGLDDIPLAGRTDPPVTTVRQPIQRTAAVAADTLIEMVGKDMPSRTASFYLPELVIGPHAARRYNDKWYVNDNQLTNRVLSSITIKDYKKDSLWDRGVQAYVKVSYTCIMVMQAQLLPARSSLAPRRGTTGWKSTLFFSSRKSFSCISRRERKNARRRVVLVRIQAAPRKLRARYLGKSEELSLARLKEVADQLQDMEIELPVISALRPSSG